MKRVTRSQFTRAITSLPYQVATVRDESGTVNYYAPHDKERRDLLAVREVSRGNVLFYLSAAVAEGT